MTNGLPSPRLHASGSFYREEEILPMVSLASEKELDIPLAEQIYVKFI
jgi:hypothetical protein